MKILELISIPTLTGAAAPMLNLSRRLKQAGCELDIYIDQYRPHNLHEILAAEGLEPCSGLALSTIAPPHKNIADLFSLVRIINGGAYDIIICHLSHDHAMAAIARAASGCRPPIVRCLHSARSLSSRPMQKLLWRHSDGVITHSQNLARELAERFAYRPERILYLPAEVDIERFRPPMAEAKSTCRCRFGFTEAEFVSGYVARIKPGRRHTELIRAFAACRENMPQMRLLIVGDGESLPEMKRLAASLGVSDRIVFTGFLDKELHQAYWAMDAYIQMAVGNDASCRAVLEAMACALPVRSMRDAVPAEYFDSSEDEAIIFFDEDGIKSALNGLYHLAADARTSPRRMDERHCGHESAAFLSVFLETL